MSQLQAPQEQQVGPLAASLRELRLQQEALVPPTESQPTSPPAFPTQNVQVEVEGDDSIMGTVKDTLFGLASGPAKAVDEVLDLSWGVGNYVKEGVQQGFDKASFREPSKEEKDKLFRFHSIEPTTQAGKIAQGLSQGLTGFVATGYALKGAQILQGASTASQVARPILQGALGDFATLDANEERLSNIVETYPTTSGPLTAFLATNPTDNMLVGRLKAAGEGAVLGMAFDGLVSGMQWLGKELIKKGFSPADTAEYVKSAALVKEWRKSSTLEGGNTAFEQVEKAAKKVFDAERKGIDAEKKSIDTPSEGLSPSPIKKKAKGKAQKELLPAEQIKNIVDKAADATEAFQGITDSTNLRRVMFDSPQGSHVLRDMGDALADKSLKGAGKEGHGKILQDVVSDMKNFGIDSTELLSMAGDTPQSLHAVTRHLLSNRNILHTLTTEASHLAGKINLQTASPVEQAQFAMLTKNMQELHLSIADARTELGRALSSLNITADGKVIKESVGEGDAFLNKWFGTDGMTNDDAVKWMAQNGWDGEQITRLAKDIEVMDGDAGGIVKALNNTKPGSWFGVIIEVRMNGLLSGHATWTANGLANALKTVVMPTERIIGGLMTMDKEAVQSGFRTYVGLYKYMNDAWNMMGKAWNTGQNVLDRKSGVMEIPTQQMSYENIKNIFLRDKPDGTKLNALQELIARKIGWAGKYLNIPSRIMISTDELFKQLNFRADMYSRLYKEAVDEKGLKSANDIASYVETKMRDAFNPDGSVARGELTAASLLRAQQSTWTQELGAGTLGNWVQTGASRHPAIRLMVPFVKTPTNIIRDFMAHTPTAALGKKFRDAYRQGGEARADALGQIAMGTFTAMSATMLAYQGLITGSPPQDPKLRQALEATGWEPYSLKIGDSYVSYRRLDPVGMFLGMAADVVAVCTGRDDLTELESDEIFLGLSAAAVNNITSKTYMQGISETINALQHPERYGKSFAGRFISTFIPASAMLRSARKEIDPHMREMAGVLDYVKNTVPGLSNTLPARRHWVTGEMVDYRIIGQDKHNIVLDELQHLGKSVYGAPLKKLKGVKLTSAQYSRLCELHGTVKRQGLTMPQALERLFQSKSYDLAREWRANAPDGINENPRATKVNRVIDAYRDVAQRQLRREDPELNREVNRNYASRRLSKVGVMTKDNQQGLVQKLTQ